MKKTLLVFGVMLFASSILTSCSDNKSDESDTNDQSDLDFAQELPEDVEQSTALQGDGLVNVIA